LLHAARSSIAPWILDFIEECAAFPNSAYDDQVDAMSQALVRFGMRPQFEFERIDADALCSPSYFRM
jgi:phage terminase large subunit-like protein